MIKIITKPDLNGLDKLKIPDVFRKCIKEYYEEMLSRFECDTLEGLGSIFVLDSKEAVIASKLNEFLENHPPYRVVGMTLYEQSFFRNKSRVHDRRCIWIYRWFCTYNGR